VETAYKVNVAGTRNVVVAAEKIGAKVCYISTDYVFDGTGSRPYQEYDMVHPINVYGKSKYAGELLTQSLSSKYFIVRTSWVYGHHGHNFVKTMLQLANERKEIKVVHDQIGSPTYTEDLALFLSELVATEKYGIYHASNRGMCSWYEFAKEIFLRSGIKINVNPITTEEYPTSARRPAYSVLDDIAIRVNGYSSLPHWKEGLDKFFRKMGISYERG
jgi:dTDP-4-dehydrorhamnose reductase